MTSPTIMTREELLELAALDTYGLLDAFESELYTRSFHHAPAAVQDEIVRLQAQLATDESLMPGEDPPAELRLRVLAAVNRAIARRTSELAPLATIGRRRAMVNEFVDRFSLRPTAPLWRAAAFILCGMVVVMAYFWGAASRYNDEVTRLALNGNTSAQLEQMIGPTFKDYLLKPGVSLVHLRDAGKLDSPIRAVLLLDESTETAFVVFSDLPQTKGQAEYRVAVAPNTAGDFTSIGQAFASDGPLGGLRISLKDVAITAASKWRITGPRGLVLASI